MQIIADIDHAAFQGVQLALITPDDTNADLHDALVAGERVHEVSGAQNLTRYRLGYMQSNKRCFALVEGRKILSAIYTYAAQGNVLPGHVGHILNEPSQKLQLLADVIAFYSISNMSDRKGVGQLLIRSLHAEFVKSSAPPILTTLSPLRSFRAWIEEQGHDLSGIRDKAAEYLKLKRDPVQKFHQGNGAIVGAIHIDANAPGTRDAIDGHGVMISYRYPRQSEYLDENRAAFLNGDIPVAAHLKALFSEPAYT